MGEVDRLRHQEEQAYVAFRNIQAVLDPLPDDHPSIPMLLEAVAVAASYWHKLLADLEAVDPAARGNREVASRSDALMREPNT